MSIRNLMKNHQDKEPSELVEIIVQKNAETKSYSSSFQGLRVEQIVEAMSALIKDASKKLDQDYAFIAAHAIIKIIEVDPNFSKDSIQYIFENLNGYQSN